MNGPSPTFAFAAYPLSGGFRAALEEEIGDRVDILVLPELRRLGVAALLQRLARLRGSCLIVFEDPGSEVLLPILECLAAATRAQSISVVRADGTRHPTSRARAARHALSLAAASAVTQVALRAARRELDELLAEPRADAMLEGRRVLYLNTNLWFGVRAGGSIAHIAGVTNALADAGYEVTLATAGEPPGLPTRASVLELEPPHTYGLPVESNLYRFGRSVPAQLRALRAPSFVYQRHSVGSYAGAVLARRAQVPFVLEYNGSEVWVARHWGRPLRYETLAVKAEEASLRHAHLVVTVSRVLADELVARGVDARRVVWHPNGVDPAQFDPARFTPQERAEARRRHGIAEDAVVVTFVGTFGQWHGVDVLARAIRDNAAWARERGVRFVLVGDGLKMPEVRATLAGLDDVVTLTGLVPQHEAPVYLAAADVLVSPHVPNADGSPFFGSPTKLFEYMAAGKAIVASDLDQIGEVLADGVALLVRPGDAEDLARALRAVVADPALRATLGGRARERVVDRYTWAHHVRAVLDRLDAAKGPSGEVPGALA